jgi:predicted ester cyclase
MPTGDVPTQQRHDLRALSRRWFEEVWNKGREEVIDRMIAAGTPARGLAQGGRELVGPAAFKEFYRPMRAAFPDIHITLDDVLVEGDQSVCRLTAHATHTGDGLGVPPTGRRISFTAIVWLRWRDGQVVDGWNEFDSAHLMGQITGSGAGAAGTAGAAGAAGAATTTAAVKAR